MLTKALVPVLLYAAVIYGQPSLWPEVLATPFSQEPPDSGNIQFTHGQDIKLSTYKNENTLLLLKNNPGSYLEQYIKYNFSNDQALGVQNHLFNLSGLYLRKRIPFQIAGFGVEWIPVGILSRQKNSNDGFEVSNKSSGIGSMRAGPVFTINYYNLPCRFSGGGAIDVWQENLPYHFTEIARAGYEKDPGFYGSVKIGDNTKRLIESIPLYIEGSVFGKYMSSQQNSKITVGEVNGLFAQYVNFADSFFVFCSDTLSKGRTISYIGEATNPVQLTSTPNRTVNSLKAAVGIRDIGKLLLRPSFIYGFDQASVSYLPTVTILGDEQSYKHTLSGLVQSYASLIDYAGGISFQFDNEDHLYKSKIPDRPLKTDTNVDTVVENAKDYTGFFVDMYHALNKTFNNGMGFGYVFDINKDHREYPHYFLYPGGKPSVREDRDKVNMQHNVEVTFFSSSNFTVSTLFNFIKDMSVFLRKEKSALNQYERIYRLEATFLMNTKGKMPLKEIVGAVAKTTEYQFPAEHLDPQDQPPMSRKFYSYLTGTLNLSRHVSLEGYWNEVFWDYGSWISEEYINAINPSSAKNYYAIESKSFESSIEGGMNISFTDYTKLRFGSLIQYIYYWDWSFEQHPPAYKRTDKFVIFPYIQLQGILFENVQVGSKVRYYKAKNAEDYWEMNSTISIGF